MKNPPKKVFVTIENQSTDEEYLSTSADLESLDMTPGEEKSVWVYELVEKKKVKCVIQEQRTSR